MFSILTMLIFIVIIIYKMKQHKHFFDKEQHKHLVKDITSQKCLTLTNQKINKTSSILI
jgi:Ca2+/H+ antiporter